MDQAVGVAIWSIASGTICAFIAGSKKRNRTDWFGWGCIFGVFAIIRLAFLDKQMPEIEGGYRSCPHCMTLIPARASVCAQCTRDVAPAS